MALPDLERIYSNLPSQPETQASNATPRTSSNDGYFGWQVTRRLDEKQEFDTAPVADILGRTQPSPMDIRRAVLGQELFPTREAVYKKSERRKDQVIVPEADLECSTTKRQTRRVDQGKYRNRPPNRFNMHR